MSCPSSKLDLNLETINMICRCPDATTPALPNCSKTVKPRSSGGIIIRPKAILSHFPITNYET